MKKINGEDSSMQLDIGSFMHTVCGAYGLINVKYDTFRDIWGDIIRPQKISEELLLTIISQVEQKIKGILEKESFYEILYFSRRIFPDNCFKCTENEIYIYRNMMTLCFQKYCNQDITYTSWNNESSILPKCLENINILGYFDKKKLKQLKELVLSQKLATINVAGKFNICYMIEKYCYYLTYLTKIYRTACKGAEIFYSNIMGVASLSDETLVKRTTLYDKRNKSSNFLSTIGGYSNLQPKDFIDIKNVGYTFLIYQENLERIDLRDFLCKNYKNLYLLQKDFITNYVVLPVNISEYYIYASYFKNEFKEFYKFTIEDFLIFFFSVNRANLLKTSKNSDMIIQMLQRAYTSYKYDIIRENYIVNYEMIAKEFGFEQQPEFEKEKTFARIFQLLSFTSKNKADINLITLNPHKIFYKIDSNYGLIDYTQWLSILENILNPVCKDSDKKGNIFEIIVINEVKKIFGEESLWVNQKELKANGIKREIDVSFIYKDLLVILECKAVNMSLSSYVGDKKAVEFRENKNKKSIIQADKTLGFVADNAKNLNYSIPENVKGVLSLIITPGVEYIWEINDTLMINESLPRIISLLELKEIKYDTLQNDIRNKPFYKEL